MRQARVFRQVFTAASLLIRGRAHGSIAWAQLVPQSANTVQAESVQVVSGRAVLEFSGAEASKLLQTLFTNDVRTLTPESTLFGAFLTSKAKLVQEALLFTDGAKYYADVCRKNMDMLLGHLRSYSRLSKVDITINDKVETIEVVGLNPSRKRYLNAVGGWNTRGRNEEHGIKPYGLRLLVPRDNNVRVEEYDARYRMSRGAAENETEIQYGRGSVFEYSIDLLGGISYDKGCYLGQEIVARTRTMGAVRTRVLPIFAKEEILQWDGARIADEDNVEIGRVVSGCGKYALARIVLSVEGLKNAVRSIHIVDSDGMPTEGWMVVPTHF